MKPLPAPPKSAAAPMSPSLERLVRDPGYPALLAIGRNRRVPRHRVVIEAGAQPTCLYLLLNGLCAVRHTGSRDQDLLLAYLCPGDFFGEMGMLPGVPARSARIDAAADSTLLEIPYRAFLDLTQRYPGFWLELAGQLASRLRTTNRRLAEMPALHAAERVWRALSGLVADGGGKKNAKGVAIRITRQDLGKLAGCSRELAGMVVRDLEIAGRLQAQGQTLILLDQPVPEQALPSG
ncbi:cyclic nucleotide-binding domain-containing protein [Nevskia sp.]|uniref:cyclic nucleotide-binding domain-containing protein n=1 Tax=Nevskia sp. TaxID=1929292 RepID=UPI0025E0D8DF|nr:cyclic nucleotide-binding domain-containing protein [Nevskia sp.]